MAVLDDDDHDEDYDEDLGASVHGENESAKLSMNVNIGAWDLALVVAVSAQATVLAYLYDPQWKAVMVTLPIPFTVASLAVGDPVDATHVLALLILLVYAQAVRVLHHRARLPIIAAIAVAASGYCLAGWGIASIVPPTDLCFWITASCVMLVGTVTLCLLPYRHERGHRTPLPIWLKLPIIVCVVLVVVIIKEALRGFMALFPMVGVVAAYEARHSLWTIGRQIPVVMLTIAPMIAVCRLTQYRVGLGGGLALGWIAFFVMFVPITVFLWSKVDSGTRAAAP